MWVCLYVCSGVYVCVWVCRYRGCGRVINRICARACMYISSRNNNCVFRLVCVHAILVMGVFGATSISGVVCLHVTERVYMKMRVCVYARVRVFRRKYRGNANFGR